MMFDWQVDAWIVESISMTLMHFLWQACVIASVAAMGFVLLGRSPQGRYLFGFICFCGFVACPVATYQTLQPETLDVDHTSRLVAMPVSTIGHDWPVAKAVALPEAAEAQAWSIDPWQLGHLLVVVTWLVGQLLLGSRLLISSYFVFRLRQKAAPVQADLLRRAQRLSKRMGIACPAVTAAEDIGGAIAAGLFRQIIVVPTAWLTEMTPEMLSAVIAHELAHLRRFDLWINLVQRVVETLFFFHPAVWWLSKRIRYDREICCDLLAVKATNQRKHYAETLEYVARLETVRSELLVAHIGDDRMSLLRRIRWVLGQQQSSSSQGWWPAGVLAMAIPLGLVWQSYATLSLAGQQEGNAVAEVDAIPPAKPAVVPMPFDAAVEEVVEDLNADDSPLKKWKLGDYIIEPPDFLQISVANVSLEKGHAMTDHDKKEVYSGTHVVGPDGTVTLGDYGQVSVTGMTVEKATAAIHKQFLKFVDNPRVDLDVAIINSKVFYIVVERPSGRGDEVIRMPVTGNETVLDALAQLGGIDNASYSKVCIKRPKLGRDDVLQVDYEAIISGGATETNYQLLPGDRIFISTKVGDDVGVSPLNPTGQVLPSPYYQYDDIQIYPKEAELVQQRLADSEQGELPWRDQLVRFVIKGEQTSGGKAKLEDAPDDNEILVCLRKNAPKMLLGENGQAKEVSIKSKQLVAEYADDARFYPFAGKAQLHHAHYKVQVAIGEMGGNEAVKQTYFIAHQHLHVVEGDDRTGAAEFPSTEAKKEFFARSYYVADLVVPIRRPEFTKSGEQRRVKDAKPDFDSLVNLISSTVAPDSWDTVGGRGVVKHFEANFSLVISQTQDAHDDIVDLLTQLRMLQESKVLLRARDVKLSSELARKLGLQGKRVSLLNGEEEDILAASKLDPRSRTFGELKATLFNGQSMDMVYGAEQKLNIQAVVLPSRDSIRIVATGKDFSTSYTEKALYRKQTLLVCMEKNAEGDETKRFRLITAELIEEPKEKEERSLGLGSFDRQTRANMRYKPANVDK